MALAHYYDDLNPSARRGDNDASKNSFKSRAVLAEQSKTIPIITPIFSDFFNQNRFLPPLTPLRLELIRQSNAFSIVSNVTDCDYKVKLVDCKLMIRRVKTFPSVRLAIENSLSSKPLRFPVNACSVKPFFVPANSLSYLTDDLFQNRGGVPRFAAIAFLDESTYRGSYNSNAFHFTSQHVKSIKLTMNGITYPTPHELRPDWENDWTREYLALHLISMKSNRGSFCPLADFKDKFCVFILDMGRFQSESIADHAQLKEDYPCRLDVTFTAAPAAKNSKVMLVYSEMDGMIKISSQRHIELDYIV